MASTLDILPRDVQARAEAAALLPDPIRWEDPDPQGCDPASAEAEFEFDLWRFVMEATPGGGEF